MYTPQVELIKDFRNFLFVVWEHLGLPEPTPVQYDIAQYLQDEDEKRIVIEAFRGVGKSYITSAYACHQLLLNPEVKILVVSASKIRADDFSTFTMRLISEMMILQHLVPKGSQRQSKISFDVGPAKASHSPSVKSAGITGQLAGSRADIVIADDIEISVADYSSNNEFYWFRVSTVETLTDKMLKTGSKICRERMKW